MSKRNVPRLAKAVLDLLKEARAGKSSIKAKGSWAAMVINRDYQNPVLRYL